MVGKQRFSTSPQKPQAGSLSKKGKNVRQKSVESELEETKEGVIDPQDGWQAPRTNDLMMMWTEPQDACDDEGGQDLALVVS